MACNVPAISPEGIGGLIKGETWTATTIYLTPTTLGAITFNFLMSLSGGMMMAFMLSKGDAFWIYSGGLAGIITASAGNDLYHPIQAMILGGIGTFIAYKMHFWVERRFKIDDAVGAVAVLDMQVLPDWCYAGLFFGGTLVLFMKDMRPSTLSDRSVEQSSCLEYWVSFRDTSSQKF